MKLKRKADKLLSIADLDPEVKQELMKFDNNGCVDKKLTSEAANSETVL